MASLSLLSRSTFSAATAAAGYLFSRCLTPPTPISLSTSNEPFRGVIFQYPYYAMVLYRSAILGLSLLQATSALTGPPFTQAFGTGWAPNAQVVNPQFLQWNGVSMVVVPLIAVAAAVRLRAMDALGPNFTFEIRDPERLVTEGMYRYVQHPSYTTMVVAIGLGTWWFLRVDGVVGAFLPVGFVELAGKWQGAVHGLITAVAVIGLMARIVVEEDMLKKKFGREWEEWNARTARLIPFVW